MPSHVALYGFVRCKDGLKVCPDGVHNARCSLLKVGGNAAAVVSYLPYKYLKPAPADMVRHDEVVAKIFNRQVMLPAKFPKFLTVNALSKSMEDMESDLDRVLQRIVYKVEYQVRVLMTNADAEDTPSHYYNTFSKYILEHSGQYEYKHYFPLLTKEAKEAEFVDYAETVVKHMTQKMCQQTTYWRGKSFLSDKVLMEAYFWVRRHRQELFENNIQELKNFYPNLHISVLGPTAPYNFVQLEFAENL